MACSPSSSLKVPTTTTKSKQAVSKPTEQLHTIKNKGDSTEAPKRVKLTRELIGKGKPNNKQEAIRQSNVTTSTDTKLTSVTKPTKTTKTNSIVTPSSTSTTTTTTTTTTTMNKPRPTAEPQKPTKTMTQSKAKPKATLSWAPTSTATNKKRKRDQTTNDDSDWLWIDKYKPSDKATLCVATKKYEAVVDALTQAFKGSVRVIFLLGPPGCGKTACIDVLCKLTNIEKVVWSNPAHISSSLSFTSVMAPFADFVVREKYPTLDFGGSTETKRKQKMVVIEDIPNLHDFKQQGEFVKVVESIVYSKSTPLGPVVFILSDTTKDNNDTFRVLPDTILSHTSVKVIRFNPVVQKTIISTLKKIADKEALDVAPEKFQEIAENSNGDIRNAINTLQFSQSSGIKNQKPKTKSIKSSSSSQGKKKEAPKDAVGDHGGRDISLSLFHALGKVLYNKRLPSTDIPDDPRYRAPMKSEPGKFRKHAHVESTLFSQYIAENYLGFFSDIHDAASAADYLSESVCMISGDKAQQRSSNVDLDLQSWFVATTGVMYANSHPTKSTWTPLYKPHTHTVYRVRKNNKEIMQHLYTSLCRPTYAAVNAPTKTSRLHSTENKLLATDVVPYLSKLCERKNQLQSRRPSSSPTPKSRALISLTNSQKDWMEIMGSYSHNSLQTFGVERGSARLTEFDNIYQNHAQTSNLKFRLDVMDTEFLEKMSREALLEDDIEEWSE